MEKFIRTHIVLWKNALETVRSPFLFNCQKLLLLDLSKNNIDELATGTFDDLLALEVLDLSFNQLKALDKDIFKSLSNLRDVYFTENKLQKIDANLFHHNPAMSKIHFRNNDLRTIEDSFRMLNKLHLYIDTNPNLEHIDLPPHSFHCQCIEWQFEKNFLFHQTLRKSSQRIIKYLPFKFPPKINY